MFYLCVTITANGSLYMGIYMYIYIYVYILQHLPYIYTLKTRSNILTRGQVVYVKKQELNVCSHLMNLIISISNNNICWRRHIASKHPSPNFSCDGKTVKWQFSKEGLSFLFSGIKENVECCLISTIEILIAKIKYDFAKLVWLFSFI